jgi:hypothetical protein
MCVLASPGSPRLRQRHFYGSEGGVETSEYQRCARVLNGTSLVPPAWIQNSHTFMNSLGFPQTFFIVPSLP